MSETIRIATRNSPLALWQANFVATALRDHWPDKNVELLPMVTSGDRFTKDKLLVVGGKGLFVKELEEALLDGRADIAVHSMKDVPAELPEGLILETFCPRANPFDALISRQKGITLASLPQGAVVGTASLRRQSQLLAARPDLQIKSLRGNINTRISKMEAGEFDAIILAAAGLERLKMQQLISEQLDDAIMLPACGQGALGIECRRDDAIMQQLIHPLNDAATLLCVTTERWVNAQLGGNCHVPLAVYCTLQAQHINLRAKLLSEDGQTVLSFTGQDQATNAKILANRCVESLLAQGAKGLLGMV